MVENGGGVMNNIEHYEKIRLLNRLSRLNARARDLRAEVAHVETERDRLRVRLNEIRQLEDQLEEQSA